MNVYYLYFEQAKKNPNIFFICREEIAAPRVKYPKFSPLLLQLSIHFQSHLGCFLFLILEFKILAPTPHSFDGLCPKKNFLLKNGCWSTHLLMGT